MANCVTVHLIRTKRSKQAWEFVIDKPGEGPLETKRERYGVRGSAWRGALRMLDAKRNVGKPGHHCVVKGKVMPVVFVTTRK